VVDHHWDTVACGLALGEGGVGIDLGDRPLFLVATAEKGYADLRLTARGQGSHASTPHPDNALVRLARAIDRLAAYRPPARLTPPVVEQMAALAPYLPRSEQLTLAAMRAPALADWLADRVMQPTLRHAFRNTFTPTLARAGRQPNVVPHHAEATVNCRVLPGVSCDDLLAETRRAVADANVDVEAQQFNPASASPTRTAFFDALAAAVRSEHPGAAIIPYMMSGATDARHFRARGVTAYGLMPVVLGADEMSGIHGIDERLRAAHLEHGTRVLYHFLRGFTTRP
jgi:acetylornithine deacetylase/succinyl-diaminopimelate desuccinylase-like protein